MHGLTLLERGYQLYRGEPIPAPAELPRHTQRLAETTTGAGAQQTAASTTRMANALRKAATADAGLAAVLAAAHADHTLARQGARALLDNALADLTPAADTALGQREALRRMMIRLRMQHRNIRRAQHRALLHTHRIRRLRYRRRMVSPTHTRAIPLGALRYNKQSTSGQITRYIAEALDHLGITDPPARRNWLRGYQTLIARESGGQSAAIASEPATAPGPAQPDGYGLGYARGITQTIPTTFACYHQPGTSTNIYDPVANICASMNYVMHRYGVAVTGENLAALVQQADAHRAAKGY